jgi:hypothetical protein
VEGKTPETTVEQAQRLLASIDAGTVIGPRDRCVIAVLVYTAAPPAARPAQVLTDSAFLVPSVPTRPRMTATSDQGSISGCESSTRR